ncbi:MAG: hypothetical protein CL908_00015 [Deltaproteobacteria bacterium]|jgi:DNA-binding NtrC family response regulator|nr:hypothetical protein [Deltaproteobacteria bacterium]
MEDGTGQGGQQDEFLAGADLGRKLEEAGFEVSYSEGGVGVLAAVIREAPDVVVSESPMTDGDPIELVRRVRSVCDVPVLILTPPREKLAPGTGSRGWSPANYSARTLTAAEVRLLARREFEGELRDLLYECRGNIAEMARRMGKDRSTVRYHLRRLGMLDEAPCRGVTAPGGCGEEKYR